VLVMVLMLELELELGLGLGLELELGGGNTRRLGLRHMWNFRCLRRVVATAMVASFYLRE
jgi:hypothetical protein